MPTLLDKYFFASVLRLYVRGARDEIGEEMLSHSFSRPSTHRILVVDFDNIEDLNFWGSNPYKIMNFATLYKDR
ncbi:hypothetical protein WG66_015775 [Moniliophthora roreri]|nr:hypothetical protein WG66_015775 [Moniliophthora roreri]